MKLLYTFLLFGLCACNNQNSDTIKIAKTSQTNSPKGPVVVAISKEDENRALGNIYFGISVQEFEQQKKLFNKSHNGTNGYSIGEWSYDLIRGRYQAGKLYELDVLGDNYDLEYYNEKTKADAISLSHNITSKYGKSEIDIPIPSAYSIRSGEDYRIKLWRIAKKTIEVLIHSGNGSYYTILRIGVPPVNQKDLIRQQYKDDSSRNANKDVF